MLDSQPHFDPARVPAGRSLDRSMMSQIALFRDLKAPELARIEQLCRYRRFSADEHIVDRDSTSTDVYFLVRGRVRRKQLFREVERYAGLALVVELGHLLLDLGARVDAIDETGGTALTVAVREAADPSIIAMLEQAGVTLDLLSAVTLKRYDLAAHMLQEDPARVGLDGRDTIALHLLVAKKNADAVRWLIDRGVDVNAKRVLWDCNHTALHVTTELEGGAIELTRMLLDAGADPNIRDDKYHATVLGWAEYCGQPQIADLLRQRGATT